MQLENLREKDMYHKITVLEKNKITITDIDRIRALSIDYVNNREYQLNLDLQKHQ